MLLGKCMNKRSLRVEGHCIQADQFKVKLYCLQKGGGLMINKKQQKIENMVRWHLNYLEPAIEGVL